MRVSELYEVFHDSTDTLSTQVRYVNYGFIAVIWILSGQQIDGLKDNGQILFFVVLSLALDLLQYIWKSVAVWLFARNKEKKEQENQQENDNYLFPGYIFVGTWLLFIFKILSTIAAAILLVIKLCN